MAEARPLKIQYQPFRFSPLFGIALALSLNLGFCPITSVWADEALKGNIEETSVAPIDATFNPAVPMAVPVIKKKKLKGTVDENTLKGRANDDGENFQGMSGKADDSNALKGSAIEDNPNTLKATLSQDQLQSEDPDRDDQMMAVEWDKWRNRLLWSIQSGVTEIVNNPENMVRHFDAQSGRVILAPNIPLGTRATFFVRVSNDRRIVIARIVQSSGNAGYDKALLDAIYSLDGSTILRYPSGSKRIEVNEEASIITSDHAGREFFKFGDVEKYRTP